ncbi:MAG TPA: tetratricopeptide repeat protein [Rhodopila sp.]|uniref:tetratricopeptide repeat protein n=1 Tax=Rhodopila sp. TaxID=2480087 RepID=UPI002C9878AE|nr:tetratricopeptide repeat protein [Rhodopila sp.]HVY16375.1 tetratricopeptide repeat protein [Rhodopila sp.]
MDNIERNGAALRLLQACAWQEAEAAAGHALAASPHDPAALLLRGLAIAAMGEADRAAPDLLRVAALRPDARHPCIDLAELRPPLPRPLIQRQFQACLRHDPTNPRLRLTFAEFLLDNDHPEQAETVLDTTPRSAAAHHLHGLARAEQGRFVQAIDSFRNAVALDPKAAASWSNLGMALKVEGRFDEALRAHDHAVALAPAHARFRVNRAVTLLRMGQWHSAWADYEARLDLAEGLAIDPHRLLPSLRPEDTLSGTTVLALHEDGFGDTLQFCRYLPLLAWRGARVVACVPPALARLIAALPGVAQVVTDRRDVPAHDYVCPMFSLPRVFGTTPQTVPPVVGPDLPAAIPRFRHRLPAHGLLTGLVWAGQARPAVPGFRTLDRRRSAGLAAFAPLAAVPGVRLVSLQAGRPARETPPDGMTLLDPMTGVRDFADTAAIIASLDVVVSVDTSVAHLAGLVGKPVFLLDRYDGCWRWLSGRRDSPWYPGMTLFRQPAPGDWTSPMRQVAASLHAMALYRGGTRVPAMEAPAFVA